jgi:hypothetical protein
VERSGRSINITVGAFAEDNVGVTRMVVLVDGEVAYETQGAELMVSLKITTKSSQVQVLAYDAAGNVGKGQIHTVTR